MKKIIRIIALGLNFIIFSSCADSKTFIIDNEEITVEPYGWANSEAEKNDKIIYQISVGNIVWSTILSGTIVVPLVLTGYTLFEPVKLKNDLSHYNNDTLSITQQQKPIQKFE